MPGPTPLDHRLRPVQKALIGLFVVFLVGSVTVGIFANRLFDPAAVTRKTAQGDYRLETTIGTEFSAATLQGAGPSLVFFGYTHCPDVCPTTLGDIAEWQHELGDSAQALRVFLISVDPERDSIPQMRDYLSWTDAVIGVTGPRAEINKAIKAFGIYSSDPPDHQNGTHAMAYSVDHSTSVLLFDTDGVMVDQIRYQTPVADALTQLKRLLSAAPPAL